jgi:hypothetical protein
MKMALSRSPRAAFVRLPVLLALAASQSLDRRAARGLESSRPTF